jgi:DNA polymerase III delta subunit
LILARTPETPDVNARKKERRLINAALDKIIEGKDGGGVIFDCTIDPNNSGAAVRLLQEEAQNREIELSPPIAMQLVERCGTDLQLLINELEKCALFAGQNPISLEVVAEMTQPALHNTTFDLIDATIDRQGARALDIVRQLFAANISPEQLLGQLIGHLRLLFQARALLDAGVSDARSLNAMAPQERAQFPNEGMVALLANPGQKFRANKMLSQARRLSIAQIQSALEMALETDLALKGVSGDGGFLPAKNASRSSLEILIARLCGK